MTGRRIDRSDDDEPGPAYRDAEGLWRVRDFATARAVLRSTTTVQGGLGVDLVSKLPSRIRRPVLYWDGPEHREYRRQTAQYFTPKRVHGHYREVMESIVDEQIARLHRQRRVNLSDLSFAVAVEVAKAVLGLTESRPHTDRRLDRFFPEEVRTPSFRTVAGFSFFLRQLSWWASFYLGDVRPAIRARRRRRRDDLISHLLDLGCTDGEILGECLTTAAAGMVTTREFINVAAWHLLTDADLRARYVAGDEAGRLALLHEIVRLEPPAGSLRRRTTAEVGLPDGSSIAAGEVVVVSVSAANVDPDAVGESPGSVCPHRTMPSEMPPAGLSFGDGAHRCPGFSIAMLESDVFLSRLFAIGGLRLSGRPRVAFNPEFASYSVRDLVVTLLSED